MNTNSLAAPQEIKEFDHTKPGLVFDADSITLLGKFTDELSAFRAKKVWQKVFAHHFLLEAKRDYSSLIGQFENSSVFYLQCTFESACGRYAFWRLVNQQAQEAENKLQTTNMVNKKVVRFLLGSVWDVGSGGPWVMSGDGPKRVEGRPSIFGAIIRSLRRVLR